MEVFDVTLGLREDMPTYAGEPGPSLESLRSIEGGDHSNVTALSLGSHTGTHVDAPYHFVDGGSTIDALAPDVLVGPALVVEHTGADHVTAADLEAFEVPVGCRRLLVKTANGRLWEDDVFHEDFLALAPDAGEWLVARGIELVGIDYLSIERFRAEGHPVHAALLGGGVVVVEGLDLRAAEPGEYLLVCAPLKVVGADGAPARVFLVRHP